MEPSATTNAAHQHRGQTPQWDLLVAARKRLGYHVEAVARHLGISERALDMYESGLREIPDGLLDDLLDFYGLDRDRFYSGAKAETVEASVGGSQELVLWLGWMPITPEHWDNESIVKAIGATVRTMRHLDATTPLTIRADELSEIAKALDLEDPELPVYMNQYWSMPLVVCDALVGNLRTNLA